MKVPFSQAQHWVLQRQYYEQQGIKAWQEGEVPQYITSNPSMARTYAEIVLGLLRDRSRLYGKSSEVVHILELGGGSGRFAYSFLKHLSLLTEQLAIQLPSYRYVLSDFNQQNIDFWKSHSRFQPDILAGLLDFARFDAEHDSELVLQVSGDTIQHQSLGQPIIVIANYFFDTIPQDLFYFNNGHIFECFVENKALLDEGLSIAEQLGQSIRDIVFHYEKLPAYIEVHQDDRELLESYRGLIKDSHILIPRTGLSCLRRLQALSTEGILVLSADKGYHRIEELDGLPAPSPVHHGSFSLNVNYHAFQDFYARSGGQSLFSTHSHHHLNIACFLYLPSATDYVEANYAYQRFVNMFGPDDFYSVKSHFEQHVGVVELEQLLAYFRLSGYDAQCFKKFIPHLLALLPHSSSSIRKDISSTIDLVWEWYYPIGESHDLAFDLGMLHYQMSQYEKALQFFQHSLNAYSATAPVYYNIAASYYQLEMNEKAIYYANESLSLQSDHEGSLWLIDELNERDTRIDAWEENSHG